MVTRAAAAAPDALLAPFLPLRRAVAVPIGSPPAARNIAPSRRPGWRVVSSQRRLPGKAVRNPQVVRAMLEDYRAGLSVNRQHEEADRAATLLAADADTLGPACRP